MRRQCRQAFTLIELLVVIAIIALIAAMLFPVFAHAREKARQTACLSQLKQIGVATDLYVQDWDETLPHAVPGVGFVSNFAEPTAPPNFLLAVLPYVKSREIFVCPTSRHAHPSQQAD